MKRVEVAIAVIESENKILICQRRAHGSFPSIWEFPGGKVEPGESPRACVVREVQEELGILVHPVEAFETIEQDYAAMAVRIHPYLCRHLAGNPLPLASQRFEWIEPARLTEYAFPAANQKLIPQILQRLHQVGGQTVTVPPSPESQPSSE